ncbi:MAG: hypothetical protein GY803_13225 [Chloroflexi bacterium]|nr:hypothetical protein [Chloroflexota bacterium]
MTSWRGKLRRILLILALLGLAALIACTETQEDALIDTATRVSVELDEVLVEAPKLAFAGKITSRDGSRWLNDYVAIVYKNNEEIGRDVSKLEEFPESGEGKHDGLFFIKIQNEYSLTAVDLIPLHSNITFQDGSGVVGVRYIYTWTGEVQPGHRISVSVPSKRIEYTLVVIPMPLSELPAEFQAGPTELADNKIIAYAADGSPLELALDTPPTAVNPPSPGTGSVSWTRTVTGFHGSRWDAWLLYVSGQVAGITWEEFKDESLRYNPDLTTDGYVFQPGKEYLFPEN